jgi:hypothetical protein
MPIPLSEIVNVSVAISPRRTFSVTATSIAPPLGVQVRELRTSFVMMS